MPLFRRNPAPPPRPPSAGAAPRAAGGRPARALDDWRSYGSVAAEYARIHSPRTAVAARDLVDLMGIPPGSRTLDVGTGTGSGARVAASVSNGLVVGVDPSPEMLAEAAGSGGRYAAAEAIDLPFRDGTFGYVLSCFVLSHFTEYKTALFDMVRVLQPGGRFGVASWGPGQDEFSRVWSQVAQEFAEREMLADARQRAMPWVDLFADPDRTREVLHDAGLREVRVERREYHFQTNLEDYLVGKEISSSGRFLREMLGADGWEDLRRRTREEFRRRFPESFNDFRDVVLAVAIRP